MREDQKIIHKYDYQKYNLSYKFRIYNLEFQTNCKDEIEDI